MIMTGIRSVGHVLAAVTSQCTEFSQSWDAAGRPGPGANEITGRWEGTWKSEATGHSGRLKCVLARQGSGSYLARFHARFSGALRACYSVQLKVVEEGGRQGIQGEANLGRLAGGIYRYDGEISPAEFFCNYRSEFDHGTFRLARTS